MSLVKESKPGNLAKIHAYGLIVFAENNLLFVRYPLGNALESVEMRGEKSGPHDPMSPIFPDYYWQRIANYTGRKISTARHKFT